MNSGRAKGNARMLKRRQDLLLDGIEVSLFSAHATFRRLLLEVHDYSETSTEDGSRIEMLGNLMLIDAWSLVDVVHRLRICVSHTPGVKKNALVKSLLKATVKVVDLRNFVQHLDSEAPKLAGTGLPIWGSLSWTWSTEEAAARGEIASMIAVSGRMAGPASFPMVSPVGKTVRLPIDLISLTAGGVTANLSAVYESVVLFDVRYRKALEVAKTEASTTDGPLSIVLEDDEDRDDEPPNQAPAPDGSAAGEGQ